MRHLSSHGQSMLSILPFYTVLFILLWFMQFYCSFSESFRIPLVCPKIYHFNLGHTGLAFLSIVVGVIIAALSCAYYYFIGKARIKTHGLGPLEHRLTPGLFGGFIISVDIFVFGKSILALRCAVLVLILTLKKLGRQWVVSSLQARLLFLRHRYCILYMVADNDASTQNAF
jgi:hypothetical protein